MPLEALDGSLSGAIDKTIAASQNELKSYFVF
jgi:hypothetical protein